MWRPRRTLDKWAALGCVSLRSLDTQAATNRAFRVTQRQAKHCDPVNYKPPRRAQPTAYLRNPSRLTICRKDSARLGSATPAFVVADSRCNSAGALRLPVNRLHSLGQRHHIPGKPKTPALPFLLPVARALNRRLSIVANVAAEAANNPAISPATLHRCHPGPAYETLLVATFPCDFMP